jgi:hypothetical protein
MSQNKQPVKKFAFSLGAKKQQTTSSQKEDPKPVVMTSVTANAGKHGSEQTNSNTLNKRPRITLDDEDDLLQSAGIAVEEG